ncbi:MAG: recombinase family protein [Actinobacteria bacterium]|nr:recombinase family protein [Actinomycetota bacterium]
MTARKAPKADVTPALRAAIYCRMSKDRQGAGLGIDRQEKACRARAEELGAAVVGVYPDNDLSASSGKRRPEYERLLADMRAGLIDIVIVWHTDRLHRRPVELEEFIAVCESRKPAVTVNAVQSGELDLATPSGRMVARMLGSAARYEVEHKSARTKESNLQAAQKGLPRGGLRAFGFEEDKITHRKSEAAALRKAVKGLLAGESLHEIARGWNKAGLLTSTGKEWNASTVRQVLERPRNAGIRVYQGEEFKAVWKPIIPLEQHKAVLRLLSDPSRKKGPGNRPRWLLSGIAHCGYDGCELTVKMASASVGAYRKEEKSRPIYRCRSGGHLARNAVTLDAWIEKLAIGRLLMPDIQKLTREDTNVDLKALHARARELRAEQESWALDAGQPGGVKPAQLRIINARIDAELEAIEAQLASASQTNVLADIAGRDDVEERWNALTLDRKRAIIDLLMTVTILPVGKGRALTFDPDGIRVEWKTGEEAPTIPRPRGNRVLPRTKPAPS